MIGGMRMGLLLLSGFGYWEYFRSRHRVNVYFAPVFTLSVQFCVLLAAGLLNCLGEAALLLHILGGLLFLCEFRRKGLDVFLPYANIGYACFLLLFLAVGFTVRGQQFTQIDNFTHWATVVRNMLSTDRFPTFRETAVEFTSYPLGSSALIYFVCKIAGEAEHTQMWAQGYFMLCAFLPVFSACTGNKGPFVILAGVMAGFLLNYNIPVTELLVDTLMPLAGMAAALFIFRHCAQQEEAALSPYYAIPLMVWTMNIKHAALIFVAFALVGLYLCIGKSTRGKRQCLLITGVILLVNVLWSRHCDYVFEEGASSRHSLSMDWFQTILGDKTWEEILETAEMVLTKAVSRTENCWLAAWFLILGVLVWAVVREEKKHYAQLALGSISMYVVYTVGILGMYVFSMENYGELLAFTRYMRAVDVAIYYMLTVFSARLVSRLASGKIAAAAGALLVLLTASCWHWQTGEYLPEQLARCSPEWRQELERPIAEYGVQPGKTYLLCVPEDYGGWPRRLWRYQLNTGAVEYVVVTDVSKLQYEQYYDYLVILDYENPVLEEWVRNTYPESVGKQVIEHFTETVE